MNRKVAIVTGGAGDIGLAVSFKLISNNLRVIIIDINDSKFQYIEDKAKSLNLDINTIKSDVVDLSSAISNIEYIINNIGIPLVLVNCAGICKDSSIINMSEEDFDKVIRVNLKGTFNYIKAIAPILKEQKQGKIINISSINGLRGKYGQANYAASKAGVIGLTKTAAIELGKYNINVNAIAPGLIRTGLIENLPENIINKAVSESLLTRMGEPEDVAELVSFLVSDKAKHITGEIIKIDGGQYL